MKTFLSALFLAITIAAGSAAETNAVPTSPSIAPGSRCFELRTYYTAPGKLEALNARFRDHTCALFKQHGMEVVGFWLPTEQPATGEKLVYLLAYPSREAATQSWKDFSNDPEWKKVRAESEANGKIVLKVESLFLAATDYSPLK